MSKEAGGPAFPVPYSCYSSGMSLRDHFAGLAMQGMIANPGMWDLINEKHAKTVAEDAYLIADALLNARGQ